MRAAKAAGIATWVSFEPVIEPEITLGLLKNAHEYADVVKIGRWNYDPRAAKIDWLEFLCSALTVCEKTGLKYYIKNDLWAFGINHIDPAWSQTNIPAGSEFAQKGIK